MGRDTFDAVLASVPLNGTAGAVTSRGTHYDPKIKVPVRRHSDVPVHSDAPARCIPVPVQCADLTGRKFGRFTVIGYLGRLNPTNEKKGLWLVRCICGNYEQRKAAGIKNPANDKDACMKCRHWRGVKRQYERLGSRPIEDFTSPKKDPASVTDGSVMQPGSRVHDPKETINESP